MDPNSSQLLCGAGGKSTAPLPLTSPLLFPSSRDASGNIYIHGVTTSGTLVGTWQVPEGLKNTASGYLSFFYNPFLVVWSNYSYDVYIVDCNTFTTYKTASASYPGGFISGWYPWSDGVYIGVSGILDSVFYLDVKTGTITEGYYNSDNSYSGLAQGHATIGFANNGSTLFSSLQNRYWWSIGQDSPSLRTWYYYADRSGSSLGARSSGYSTDTNYSRTFGSSLSNQRAYMCNIGSYFFRMGVADTSMAPFYPQASSAYVASQPAYYTGADVTDIDPRCSVPNGIYLPYRAQVSSFDLRYTFVYLDPFSSTNPSVALLPSADLRSQTTSSSGNYYTLQVGSYMSPINTSGYVALAYFDVHGTGLNYQTNQLAIRIYNGSTLVSAGSSSAIPSSFTAGNNLDFVEFGLNGCQWTSNLLYSGTNFTG